MKSHTAPLHKPLPSLRRPMESTLRRGAVLRRFSVELAHEESRVLEHIEDGVTIRCRRGSIWIVQDGDCQDVVLSPRQSFEPDCGDTLRLVALEPCEFEIEFAEEVLLHA